MIQRPATLSDDARSTLTQAAGAAVRANRPRWVIYLGALAVIVALIYTLVNLTRRVTAQSELSQDRARFAEIKGEADRLAQIKADEDALGGDRAGPDARMADRITRLATEGGLAVGNVSELDDNRPNPSKTVKRKRYEFKLTNQPAEPIFNWLKKATTDIAGLQLFRLEFAPADGNEGKPGWNVTVTFTRWERVS